MVCPDWRGQTGRLHQGAGNVQAEDTTADQSYLRPQHEPDHRTTPSLRAGLESLLQSGANAKNLAQAGRMDAASDAGNPAQAMASRHDDVPRAAETRCTCESGAAG